MPASRSAFSSPIAWLAALQTMASWPSVASNVPDKGLPENAVDALRGISMPLTSGPA
ncbi:hypothetical protein D9M68_880210 [compost metagenome]